MVFVERRGRNHVDAVRIQSVDGRVGPSIDTVPASILRGWQVRIFATRLDRGDKRVALML